MSRLDLPQGRPPDEFLLRLAETVAWCEPRVDPTRPRECHRSPELAPKCTGHPGGEGYGPRVCEGGVCSIPSSERHEAVVAARRAALKRAGVLADLSILHRTGGRLFLSNPGYTLNDGGTPHGTNGLFDDWDLPAWDLWVADMGYKPPRRPGEVDPPWETNRVVVSWIPGAFVELVETGALPWDSYGFMCWADLDPSLVPDEAHWRPYLPAWLTGLRLPIAH